MTIAKLIQTKSRPGTWSRGVQAHRAGAVSRDSDTDFRVRAPGRAVAYRVQIWPPDDGESDPDWHCECEAPLEVCEHVAACAIELDSPTAARPSAEGWVRYDLESGERTLRLRRSIEYPGGERREFPTADMSLVSLLGGIGSGRVGWPPISTTADDLAIDSVWGPKPDWARILPRLARVGPHVFLDGQAVQSSGVPVGPIWVIEDAPGGAFRLRQEPAAGAIVTLGEGLARVGATLRPVRRLAPAARDSVFRTREEIGHLVTELLPALAAQGLELRTDQLPEIELATPRIFVEMDGDSELRVSARIDYDERQAGARHWREDPAAEHALARRLQSEFHLAVGRYATLAAAEALALTRRVSDAALAEPGVWRIHGPGLRRFARAEVLRPEISADLQGLRASFVSGGAGGARVSGAGVLAAWEAGASFVPLEGGGFAPLPADWLARHGATLRRLLAVRAHQTPSARPELAQFCADLGVAAPAPWRELARELSAPPEALAPELPTDLPADVILRDYQRAGLAWLQLRRRQGIGALLADDMGLGKTLQAMCTLRADERALVVCPKSVLSAWREQLAKFRPGLRVHEYQGADRALADGPGVTLTSYPILRLDADALAAPEWDSVILDESQTIKNASSQVARAARRLRAPHRVALTGTPVENRLDDFWSQMAFLNPGYLDEAPRDPRGLAPRVRPFVLRRTKREVAPELPARTETVLSVELSPAERDLYETLRQAARAELVERVSTEEGPLTAFQALEVLLRLRQASCDPALVPGTPTAGESTKVRALAENLEVALAEGHRALVFSQWTSLLDRIEPALRARGLGFDRLDGATKDRAGVVARFQAPDGPPVLLLSLKAGGVGLTLTAADHVYIMDPWWNPAAEDQAADRAHRIGQTNPVLIHRLVASGTVEERVLAMQREKRALARALLEDAHAPLTRDDLLSLLD